MNKQELIDYCNALKENKSQIINCIDVNGIIKRIEQLDEPQKVTIPQFVADWYEKHKDDLEYDIWEYILHWGKQQKSEFYEWMNHANNKPFQTLANMHQFGYEVEKEKRYLVKVKGFDEYDCYLNKGLLFKKYFLESKTEIGGCRTKHTRKELEADGFGWVFDCEGIEVKEVE